MRALSRRRNFEAAGGGPSELRVLQRVLHRGLGDEYHERAAAAPVELLEEILQAFEQAVAVRVVAIVHVAVRLQRHSQAEELVQDQPHRVRIEGRGHGARELAARDPADHGIAARHQDGADALDRKDRAVGRAVDALLDRARVLVERACAALVVENSPDHRRAAGPVDEQARRAAFGDLAELRDQRRGQRPRALEPEHELAVPGVLHLVVLEIRRREPRDARADRRVVVGEHAGPENGVEQDAEALRIRKRAGAPPALGMLLIRDPGVANLRHEVLVDDDDHARCLPVAHSGCAGRVLSSFPNDPNRRISRAAAPR
jgi:hypothetical protein